MSEPELTQPPARASRVTTGAERLAAAGFAALAGRRVGLLTNHTGLVGATHLADLLASSRDVRLAAILAPEHGFRGSAEAGETVGDGIDARTRVPVFSLYGATRKPTPAMLRDIDVLVFDIQDIGARFYTYISTMGLAMQAAAAAGVAFMVLDRPNPLGGAYVSGFAMEPALQSFVGRYPIPLAHGMTVAELAGMIRGEGWLEGVRSLDLSVIEASGLTRTMRWPATYLPWVATSPNIPTFEAALLYPGIGLVGETLINEGRGTPTPFTLIGAPWLDADRAAAALDERRLPGLSFTPARYRPRAIAGVASNPRFAGEQVGGVRIAITDWARVEPVELGIHVLEMLAGEARRKPGTRLFGKLAMFHALAGTRRLNRMLAAGDPAATVIAAWQRDVAQFRARRQRYLRY